MQNWDTGCSGDGGHEVMWVGLMDTGRSMTWALGRTSRDVGRDKGERGPEQGVGVGKGEEGRGREPECTRAHRCGRLG
jgi:hypothetical protein